MSEFLQQSAGWLAHGLAALLCLAGIFISLLSFTGVWLIALAGLLLLWVRPDQAPGWPGVIGLLLAGAILEVFDFFAGNLGIARRGGSSAAGWAALVGGLAGMVLGGFIPLPIIGSIIGMMAGSFACAYWVERRRLLQDTHAAHIAWGAVWARLAVLLVKTVAALGTSIYLWYAIGSA